MKPYHNVTSSIEETGLRYKLMIIEGLVFVLPFFIISYIFYVNNIFLKFSQMFIFALILLIILTGLITLRQIFDRFFTMTTLMKNAVNNNEYLVDIQKDTAELHEITFNFNNLMKKYESTTSELSQRVFELFAIKELTEVASKSLDIDDLLTHLLEKAMTVTKAQTGSVFMVESEKERFRVIASKGLDSTPEKDSYINIYESLLRYVVSEKSTLLVQDIEADQRTYKQNDPKYGSPSFLSMPIFIRGNLLSVVNLSHKETGEVFNSNDQEILSIMIGEMGFALENAQLHQRLEEHVRDLQDRTVELTKANDQLQEEIINRKQSEATLKKSEESYRYLVENANDIIYKIDLNGNFIFCNPIAVKQTGYSQQALMKMHYFELMRPDYKEDAQKFYVSQYMKKIHSTYYEFPMVTKNGKEIWLGQQVQLISEGDRIIGFHAIARDISQYKRGEEKIKEYSENLEQMVEERTRTLNHTLKDMENARDSIDGILKSIADGLIVTDSYNRVILMNPAAEDLLDVRLSEIINRPIDFAIQDKTLRDRIKKTLTKKKTGYQFDFELPVENSQNLRIMRARTSGIEDKSGNQTGIITIIHDVTHEREVDQMKTEFISTAAHELRTPLTSIRGFSEVLLNRNDFNKKDERKFLTYINDQSVNLSNIINDLLDISRIESGLGFSLNKIPCDMGEIIQGIVPQFQDQTSKHHFEILLPEKSVQLKVDKEKMEQVIQNLLSNALKYSPEGGVIKVSGQALNGYYQVSVEDHGKGMTSEQAERIFDKFYRADVSDTAVPGTGLGMSIVKYLVEAHNGKVWVESKLGKGSTIHFKIPIQAKDERQAATDKWGFKELFEDLS